VGKVVNAFSLSLRWVFLLEKINQKSFSLLKTNATHTSTPGLKIEISKNVKPFFANDLSMILVTLHA
jgi:hypothetical protein